MGKEAGKGRWGWGGKEDERNTSVQLFPGVKVFLTVDLASNR